MKGLLTMQNIYTRIILLWIVILTLNLSSYSGTISGLVFNDLNGNGAKDSLEPGISGWSIALVGSTNGVSIVKQTSTTGAFTSGSIQNGTYVLTNVLQTGWMQTLPSASGSITTSINVTTTTVNGKNFGIFKLGIIEGEKFNDLNDNGANDFGEPPISGWKIYVDGAKKDSTITDISGNYSFNNLLQGNYIISEENISGWSQTLPGESGHYQFSVSSGTSISNADFGNYQNGFVGGQVFNDLNADGIKGDGEMGISGWKLILKRFNTSTLDLFDSTFSDEGGYYNFQNIPYGNYVLMEELKDGFGLSLPQFRSYEFLVSSGYSNADYDFGNYSLSTISGNVFSDANFNGIRDINEVGIQGWELFCSNSQGITIDTVETDAFGNYIISNLNVGTYFITEQTQSGWTMTNPQDGYYTVTLGPSENTSNIDFGNFHIGGVLSVFPEKNQHNVPIGAKIIVQFISEMDTSSFDSKLTFTVNGSLSGLHSGTFYFDFGNTRLTFSPDIPFSKGEFVSINASNSLKDNLGNNIVGNTSSFVVESSPATSYFEEKYSLSVGTNPVGIITADFNKDGYNDIAEINSISSNVVLLKNDGNGNLQLNGGFSFDETPQQIVSGDFNNDGNIDLAILCSSQLSKIYVFLNNNSGTFSPHQPITLETYTNSILAADFNNDGRTDLCVASPGNGYISLYTNIGNADFVNQNSIYIGNVISFSSADLDNDGDVDIIYSILSVSGGRKKLDGDLHVLENLGNNNFSIILISSITGNLGSINVNDYNTDGNLDFIIAVDSTFSLYINDGDLSFNSSIVNNPFGQISSLNSANFRGGGNVDIISIELFD